ncbi:CrcB family protein [Arthrobacter sp. zg-Y877]|uniref:fluoride efflux transporter FluC n=1 Tax=Arthrobacter sp. zg-Y877 TaxID=3049074 RepID=UPI0025A45638|nr:CrcB family protein [Arthrobacter sp. zg-Y877]MDM7989776.1 CrcB family protein [Arthrobacter sp. zg-Y877]
MTALWIGLGGMAGALLRFGLDSLLARRSRPDRPGFPWGTLLVNTAGSLLIGFAAGLLGTAALSEAGYQAAATGFAGGLTTFSSWTVATLALWTDGRRRAAAANVLLNLFLGCLAAAAGLLAGLSV